MSRALPFAALVVSALGIGCSSSSSAGEPGTHPDAIADVAEDAATDSTPVAEDTAIDDTGTAGDAPSPPDVDIVPPPDKCAHVNCVGAYQACCPSQGICYDTRCTTCCY